MARQGCSPTPPCRTPPSWEIMALGRGSPRKRHQAAEWGRDRLAGGVSLELSPAVLGGFSAHRAGSAVTREEMRHRGPRPAQGGVVASEKGPGANHAAWTWEGLWRRTRDLGSSAGTPTTPHQEHEPSPHLGALGERSLGQALWLGRPWTLGRRVWMRLCASLRATPSPWPGGPTQGLPPPHRSPAAAGAAWRKSQEERGAGCTLCTLPPEVQVVLTPTGKTDSFNHYWSKAAAGQWALLQLGTPHLPHSNEAAPTQGSGQPERQPTRSGASWEPAWPWRPLSSLPCALRSPGARRLGKAGLEARRGHTPREGTPRLHGGQAGSGLGEASSPGRHGTAAGSGVVRPVPQREGAAHSPDAGPLHSHSTASLNPPLKQQPSGSNLPLPVSGHLSSLYGLQVPAPAPKARRGPCGGAPTQPGAHGQQGAGEGQCSPKP